MTVVKIKTSFKTELKVTRPLGLAKAEQFILKVVLKFVQCESLIQLASILTLLATLTSPIKVLYFQALLQKVQQLSHLTMLKLIF